MIADRLHAALARRGWTWDAASLVAPHATMHLARDWPLADELPAFRERMRGRLRRAEAWAADDPDDAHTLADVRSLVEALDELLG